MSRRPEMHGKSWALAVQFLQRASPGQLRLLHAMPLNRPKRWRALWRHAKLGLCAADSPQLPFAIARPTLEGSEMLTELGRAAKMILEARR